MNKMQTAARKLHALGLKTIPIKPGTKIPATKNGVKDATLDNVATDAFYATHSNYGIAVSGDGFVIFDFDVKDGIDGRDELLEFDLPDTLTQTTPSGGLHMIYRTSEEIRPSVNTRIGVDVRGWHSYIVCDPTPGYCWEDDEVGIADADDRVMTFLEHVRPAKERSTRNAGDKLKEGQGRNVELFAYGAKLQTFEKSDEEIKGLMRAYNENNFEPPLDEDEFSKCVHSVLSTLPKGYSDEVKQQQKKAGRSRKFDHAAIAEKLIQDNGACFVDGMPAIRHGKVYEIGWRAVDREIILIDKNANRTNQREVQHYLSVMADRKAQSPPNLIAFKNGVLDINTMELRDYSPDDVIPNVIPHNWNANAECKKVDDILMRMSCGDDGVYLNLIQVMGMCMYRSSEFTQSAVLLGDGSNGKSTFLRMLTALLGKENISAISMSQLGKQFLTGKLAGKLANLGSEISNEFKNGDLLATFKELVDGGRMHADVKGVEGFDFENYAMIVLCANEFPRLADYTDGMMRRIFPIEFNARFRKTDADYDPRIAQKVTNESACEYMAYLGVLGLIQAIKDNGFTPNAASTKRLDEIRFDNDSALMWAIDNGWNSETLDRQPTAEKYEAYKSWCMAFGYQAFSHKKFTRTINKRFDLVCKKVKIDAVSKNCFALKNGSDSVPIIGTFES